MPDEPRHRKQLRLREYDYSSYGAYFITIVTQDRRHLLGEIVNDEMQVSVAGSLVIEAWSGLPARFPNVELDAFVVMPNHVHGILWLLHDDLPRAVEGSASGAPTTASPPQTGAVGRPTTEGGQPSLAAEGAASGAPATASDTRTGMVGRAGLGDVVRVFKSTSAVEINRVLARTGDVWQRNYFEKIIRSQPQLDALRRYIDENPLRWALDEENAAKAPGPRT